MDKQELIDACREHLRLSCACTLNIPVEDYYSSLEPQTAAKRCVTHVMAIGYNESLAEAVKEIIAFRYYGGAPSEDEFDELVEELRACRNTFHKEVAAYRHAHKQFGEGKEPKEILEEVKKLTPLGEDYLQRTQKTS